MPRPAPAARPTSRLARRARRASPPSCSAPGSASSPPPSSRPASSPFAVDRVGAHRPRAAVGEGCRDRAVRHQRQGRAAHRDRHRARRRRGGRGAARAAATAVGPRRDASRSACVGIARRDDPRRRRRARLDPLHRRRASPPRSHCGCSSMRLSRARRGDRRMPRPARLRHPTRRRASRRAFLVWTGGAAAVGVLAAIGGTLAARRLHAVDRACARRCKLPTAAVAAPPSPPAPSSASRASRRWSRPTTSFYRIDTALIVPAGRPGGLEPAHPRAWSSTRSTLTWDELLALPARRERHDPRRACRTRSAATSSATRCGSAIPIRELLARAEPTRQRRHGAVALDRRVHGVHPAGGADRTTATRSSRSA